MQTGIDLAQAAVPLVPKNTDGEIAPSDNSHSLPGCARTSGGL